MNPRRRLVAAAVASLILGGLYISVLAREETTLQNSLVDMSIFPPTRVRAVRFSNPTVLTGTLDNLTITANDGPYLLNGRVVIPPDSMVRAQPGSIIAADYQSQLVVEGTFEAEGTIFESTYLHPTRKIWHGILVQNGGHAKIKNSVLRHTSVGVTCGALGKAAIQNVTFAENMVGLVSLPETTDCSAEDLRVAKTRVGYYLLGGAPRIRNSTFEEVTDGLRIFHEAAPTISDLTVHSFTGKLVVYAATPTLTIPHVRLPAGTNPETLVTDRRTAPTHRWRDQTFPTGSVNLEPLPPDEPRPIIFPK